MGKSSSGSEMSGKIMRLSRELSNTRKPLIVTALAGKQIFAASAAAAGASRLARARYDLVGDAAIIRYTGRKAHLVNNDTKAHRIVPRAGRRGRGRRALTINGDVRASAEHKGTTGKHFFEKAREVSKRELPRVYNRVQVTEPLRKIF